MRCSARNVVAVLVAALITAAIFGSGAAVLVAVVIVAAWLLPACAGRMFRG